MYSRAWACFLSEVATMTYTRDNHLENLDLDYEHDWAYRDYPVEQAMIDEIAQSKIVVNGSTETGVLEDSSYISVDPNYFGQMSVGQRRLYELLLALQETSIYAITSIGKLAKAMDLENPLACDKRLENLQLIGAISGMKTI